MIHNKQVFESSVKECNTVAERRITEFIDIYSYMQLLHVYVFAFI